MNRLILKIYAWQNTAAPWFWLFVISAGYLATSYFFFQRCLFMSPTQMSALVRLGFAVAGVGAFIGLLMPFSFIASSLLTRLALRVRYTAIYKAPRRTPPQIPQIASQHPHFLLRRRLIACCRSYFAPQAARAPRPSPQAPRLAMCRAFSADFTARDFIWCRALNLQTRRSARR